MIYLYVSMCAYQIEDWVAVSMFIDQIHPFCEGFEFPFIRDIEKQNVDHAPY